MRVIAGTHRRRTLLPPQGNDVTRPIPDRVKQSLYDRLWSMGSLETGTALDIFSGTGSLGIEALSRGVTRCTFVERDRSARQRLEQNLATLGLTDRATILGVDALAAGWAGLLGRTALGLIFCDPPYALTTDAASMTRIAGLIESLHDVAAPDAVLTLRTDSHTQAPVVPSWAGPASHPYGSTCVHLYELPDPQAPPQP